MNKNKIQQQLDAPSTTLKVLFFKKDMTKRKQHERMTIKIARK
jgi:hypothetical protein